LTLVPAVEREGNRQYHRGDRPDDRESDRPRNRRSIQLTRLRTQFELYILQSLYARKAAGTSEVVLLESHGLTFRELS
jgi:hypothetical protein